MAVTNAVSWRSEGIKYRKNEVFLDVIESLNLLVSLLFLLQSAISRFGWGPSSSKSLENREGADDPFPPLNASSPSFSLQVNANGDVIRSEILGSVKMKCYLSGMPELRLGLNDKVMFESTGRSEFGFPFLRPFSVAGSMISIFGPSNRTDPSTSLILTCSITRKVHRDGGRQVPSVRSAGSIRERQDDLVHSS